jgi:hypothetical protein
MKMQTSVFVFIGIRKIENAFFLVAELTKARYFQNISNVSDLLYLHILRFREALH